MVSNFIVKVYGSLPDLFNQGVYSIGFLLKLVVVKLRLDHALQWLDVLGRNFKFQLSLQLRQLHVNSFPIYVRFYNLGHRLTWLSWSLVLSDGLDQIFKRRKLTVEFTLQTTYFLLQFFDSLFVVSQRLILLAILGLDGLESLL